MIAEGSMITVEKWEEIRRLYYVEKKSMRRIMAETGFSWRTVKRAIKSEEPGKYRLSQPREAPVLGPYKERIEGLLAENEKLPRKQQYTSPRIYAVLKEEGYQGSESTVRHFVSQVRKRERMPKVYLPLTFEPGTDGQVDWGEAEVILQGRPVTVQLFIMRLNYSRRHFVMAFPRQKQEAFFAGHVAAFEYFQGVPARLTYDNLKAAVHKILKGKNREEQKSFVHFRGHYLFDSHFCTPSQGHEKGGVENGVGYVRRQFLVPPPVVESYEELNAHLRQACLKDDERQVKGQSRPIGEMWREEQPRLRPLPAHAFDCCRRREVRLTPYSQVVLETNRYSVPVDQARAQLMAKLYPFRVEIHGPGEETLLAVHERCYEREQDIFDPLHYLPLFQQRPGAFNHAKPMQEWRSRWPTVYEEMLKGLQERWPEGQGVREFIAILQLHREYPAAEIEKAVESALKHGTLHRDGVMLCLNQSLNPDLEVPRLDLDQHPQLQDVGVQAVNLAQYEALLGRVS